MRTSISDTQAGTFAADTHNCMGISNLHLHAGLKTVSHADTEPKEWYVLRDLKRANALLPAYEMLGNLNIEVFTPMREQVSRRRETLRRTMQPVIHGLLFAHTTRAEMDDIISATPTLQYRFLRGYWHRPMTVPEREMTDFMTVVGAMPCVHYMLPEEIDPGMYGKRVRIIGGTLDGQEGTLKSTRGSRRRHLLVQLEGILAADIDITDCEYTVLV